MRSRMTRSEGRLAPHLVLGENRVRANPRLARVRAAMVGTRPHRSPQNLGACLLGPRDEYILTKRLGMCPSWSGDWRRGFDAAVCDDFVAALSRGCSVARVRVMRLGLQERLPHEAKHAVGQTSVVAP